VGSRSASSRRRLHAWRDRPGRLSRTGEAYAIPRFAAIKAAFLAERFLADSDAYVLWGYGGTGRAAPPLARGHGKRATHVIEVHPGRLGNVIHGARWSDPKCWRAWRRCRSWYRWRGADHAI
jgi:hypothetical protein